MKELSKERKKELLRAIRKTQEEMRPPEGAGDIKKLVNEAIARRNARKPNTEPRQSGRKKSGR